MTRNNVTRWWSIAVLDIVGYSDLTEDEQRRTITHLTTVVKRLPVLRRTAQEKRIFLPTGDGMAIGFNGLPEAPAQLAKEVHQQYGDKRFLLKIGIHAGIAFEINDINGAKNIAGSGINWAQRTVSCCSGGHILVAADPGETLAKLDKWRSFMRGPYLFRVKRGRELRAYNLVDEVNGIGNPSEPLANRGFEATYQPLRARLAKHGVGPSPSLGKTAQARLKNPLLIDNVYLEGAINGFWGVPPDQVETVVRQPEGLLPYVQERRHRIPAPSPNRPKVYITEWVPPLTDAGERLILHVSFSDFWTTCAVEESVTRIQKDIVKGRLDIFHTPRQLDCHTIVVTADKKVILLRRTEALRYDKGAWCAIGESIDGEWDVSPDRRPNPLLTVQRALGREELGLTADDAKRAIVKFIAITTEWHTFHSQLVTLARLPFLESSALRDLWLAAKDKEHNDFDAFDFTPERCLQVVLSKRHRVAGQPGSDGPLVATSRLALLAAVCSEYGYGAILDGITAPS